VFDRQVWSRAPGTPMLTSAGSTTSQRDVMVKRPSTWPRRIRRKNSRRLGANGWYQQRFNSIAVKQQERDDRLLLSVFFAHGLFEISILQRANVVNLRLFFLFSRWTTRKACQRRSTPQHGPLERIPWRWQRLRQHPQAQVR
jgi:hypothetical protein